MSQNPNSVNDWDTGSTYQDDDGFGEPVTTEGRNLDGGFVQLPGLYLFMVGPWKYVSDKSPKFHQFELTVQHTFDGQDPIGAKLTHAIFLRDKDGNPAKDGSLSVAANFFVGLELMKKEKRDGNNVAVNLVDGSLGFNKKLFDAAVGRICWGEVRLEENRNDPSKKYARLSFGHTYPIDDSRFSDKDADPVLMDVAGFERVNGRWQRKTVASLPYGGEINGGASQQPAQAAPVPQSQKPQQPKSKPAPQKPAPAAGRKIDPGADL